MVKGIRHLGLDALVRSSRRENLCKGNRGNPRMPRSNRCSKSVAICIRNAIFMWHWCSLTKITRRSPSIPVRIGMIWCTFRTSYNKWSPWKPTKAPSIWSSEASRTNLRTTISTRSQALKPIREQIRLTWWRWISSVCTWIPQPDYLFKMHKMTILNRKSHLKFP